MAGLKIKYFVLKPESKVKGDMYAKASRSAMRAYSDVVSFNDPDLAHDLRQWVNEEDMKDDRLVKKEE